MASSSNNLRALAGGLAGAAAVTLINETARRKIDNAPRLEKMGIEATEKLFRKTGNKVPAKDTVFGLAMAGDLLTNMLYYRRARGGTVGETLLRGAALGLLAGVSAVLLPEKLGLDDEPTNKTTGTKMMTVAWYLAGGLVAAGVNLLLSEKKK